MTFSGAAYILLFLLTYLLSVGSQFTPCAGLEEISSRLRSELRGCHISPSLSLSLFVSLQVDITQLGHGVRLSTKSRTDIET